MLWMMTIGIIFICTAMYTHGRVSSTTFLRESGGTLRVMRPWPDLLPSRPWSLGREFPLIRYYHPHQFWWQEFCLTPERRMHLCLVFKSIYDSICVECLFYVGQGSRRFHVLHECRMAKWWYLETCFNWQTENISYECIYQGPGNYYVPKDFRLMTGIWLLAELGFYHRNMWSWNELLSVRICFENVCYKIWKDASLPDDLT